MKHPGRNTHTIKNDLIRDRQRTRCFFFRRGKKFGGLGVIHIDQDGAFSTFRDPGNSDSHYSDVEEAEDSSAI